MQRDSTPLPDEITAGCFESGALAENLQAGRATYRSLCTHCHQENGIGVPGMVPALADSARLAADPERGVRMILASQSPTAHLEGMAVLDLVAPLEQLNDQDVADVLNYVLNAWGNCAGIVDATDVARLRVSGP